MTYLMFSRSLALPASSGRANVNTKNVEHKKRKFSV